MTGPIRRRRIYEPPAAKDGRRIPVARLRSRGARKVDAAIDIFLEEIAPSGALRRRLGHDPARREAFGRRLFRICSAPLSRQVRKLQWKWEHHGGTRRITHLVEGLQVAQLHTRRALHQDIRGRAQLL